MVKTNRLNIDDCLLVLIDFQERLMPSIYENENIEDSVCKLVRGCRFLGVPIITTQQYTKGLGETVPSILKSLNEPLEETSTLDMPIIEKVTFSCMMNDEFAATVQKTGRKTVILTGVESHICVSQTALDLINNGYEVILVNDCVSSRKKEDKEISLRRLGKCGAIVSTYESVLFELTGSAKHPQFRNISKIVK